MSEPQHHPAARPARDRLELFADLTADLPRGPWLACANGDGRWQVVAEGSRRVVARELDEEAADALSSAGAFLPQALRHWSRALDAAEALAELATRAGADPREVAATLGLSRPDTPADASVLDSWLRNAIADSQQVVSSAPCERVRSAPAVPRLRLILPAD